MTTGLVVAQLGQRPLPAKRTTLGPLWDLKLTRKVAETGA